AARESSSRQRRRAPRGLGAVGMGDHDGRRAAPWRACFPPRAAASTLGARREAADPRGGCYDRGRMGRGWAWTRGALILALVALALLWPRAGRAIGEATDFALVGVAYGSGDEPRPSARRRLAWAVR